MSRVNDDLPTLEPDDSAPKPNQPRRPISPEARQHLQNATKLQGKAMWWQAWSLRLEAIGNLFGAFFR